MTLVAFGRGNRPDVAQQDGHLFASMSQGVTVGGLVAKAGKAVAARSSLNLVRDSGGPRFRKARKIVYF